MEVQREARLQEQARALGDPTRHRIFRLVAEADGPIGIAELTSALALTHNAVRQHLAKLSGAGLVTEEQEERHQRGRPRLLFRLAAGAAGSWNTSGPYERLSLLLLEVLRSHDSPAEVGRREGRLLATRPSPSDDPLTALLDEIARQGFEPRAHRFDDVTEIVLGRCPFASAAVDDPGTVCSLHRGLAEGLVEELAAHVGGHRALAIRDLVTRNPVLGGCRLVVGLQSSETVG